MTILEVNQILKEDAYLGSCTYENIESIFNVTPHDCERWKKL